MPKNSSVLRGLRNEKGYTQHQLAELLGVNVKQVTRWETKTQTPRVKYLNELITVFNLTPNETYKLVRDYNKEETNERD